jgi:hypothetical protein
MSERFQIKRMLSDVGGVERLDSHIVTIERRSSGHRKPLVGDIRMFDVLDGFLFIERPGPPF